MTSFAIAPTKSATTLFSEDGLTLSNDHIAIFLVLICAWKMYVVNACFYMNDIHVKKYITELAYWPILFLFFFYQKRILEKISNIYIIHSASTIVWITIKQISQCLRIVVYNIYCVVFFSCFSLCILCCQVFSTIKLDHHDTRIVHSGAKKSYQYQYHHKLSHRYKCHYDW